MWKVSNYSLFTCVIKKLIPVIAQYCVVRICCIYILHAWLLQCAILHKIFCSKWTRAVSELNLFSYMLILRRQQKHGIRLRVWRKENGSRSSGCLLKTPWMICGVPLCDSDWWKFEKCVRTTTKWCRATDDAILWHVASAEKWPPWRRHCGAATLWWKPCNCLQWQTDAWRWVPFFTEINGWWWLPSFLKWWKIV